VKLIVVRGATGVCAWALTAPRRGVSVWTCTRDQTSITSPSSLAGAEAFLTQLAQHSVTLVGAISQVIELDV
jgi:hypothetical protein